MADLFSNTPADLAIMQSALGITSRPEIIAQAGRSGVSYGTGAYQDLFVATLDGGVIEPNCILDFEGQYAKYAPPSGGATLRIRFEQGANAVTVGTISLGATIYTYAFAHSFSMSDDRKWAFPRSISNNFHNAVSVSATTDYTRDRGSTSPTSAKNPRAKGPIAFATYSAPPTVETLRIDFSQPVTVRVQVNFGASDSCEILNFRITKWAKGNGMLSGNSKSTLIMGDSITEPTGATSFETGWPAIFAKARPGRPIIADGLGGQMITPIIDRFMSYGYASRYWDAVIFAGENDVGGSGPVWWATVEAQLDRALAVRSSTAKTMICNFYANTAWTAGQVSAMDYVNAQIASKYGAIMCDIYSAMTSGGVTNPAYLNDTIHPNDAGHSVIGNAVHNRATALGWA